ncbi:thioredoxin family protein [Psychrobacillus sp.]|uniref:thioredoxin family protein n=1 Tax=Psychrobacillus sp. TaxID=1871623 RepID=UPI0028BD3C47|nr:thioredoxin family protein [Psychrobacillus sp.]
MNKITSFGNWLEITEQTQAFLLFVKIDNCSVCEGLYPQVQLLKEEANIPFYVVNVSEVPEMAGQLSLYTAPVVLLWHRNKEYMRFARFVPMESLRDALKEIELMENDYV